MATIKVYLKDSSILRTAAIIRDMGTTDDGRTWLRLDQTIFHAQGGGQKSDRGSIGTARVVHVAHGADGEVDHFVDSAGQLARGKRVDMEVDHDWRCMNARLHSAGHLLAALVEARCPTLRAVAGHHWPGEARVEFEGSSKPPMEELESWLATDIAAAIGKDFPVSVLGDPFSERLVQIGPYPAVPCGGTHVHQLSMLGSIHVDRLRVKSGRVRMSYDISP